MLKHQSHDIRRWHSSVNGSTSGNINISGSTSSSGSTNTNTSSGNTNTSGNGRWEDPYKPATDAQRGSVLMLFPAAVLVMLVLAAIVIDYGFVRVRALELRAVAASAANDVLGAVDTDALRSTGMISFDLDIAADLARTAVEAGPLPHATVENITISDASGGRWEIAVTLSVDIDPVIAPALPGGYHNLQATVTERVLVIS